MSGLSHSGLLGKSSDPLYPYSVPTTTRTPPVFRRALLMMTVSSFLVPAAGVLTSPILARALGADGRGVLAAALAPAYLILPVATLGLPDSLTNLTARHPSVTRPALAWATLLSSGVGVICWCATLWALPFLSAGSAQLGHLILLATALTIPALVVGVFRGAATGRQMWGAVAVERAIITALRILVLVSLWMFGELTVFRAVLMSCLIPIVAAVVYWRLFTAPPRDSAEQPLVGGTLRPLVLFGSKVWFGSVASMLLSRIGQLLMTPLSSAQDLGLYVVATTISDMPLIVALAIQGALFGVNSKSNDSAQVTTTARLTLLVGIAGCAVLGGSLPFWIKPLFGEEFDGAVVPTLMLLFSALICIPGLMAAAGLSAWKRPGLRSIGLVVSLIANLTVFLLLVPHLGVIGACWTSVVSNVVLTGFMVTAASRVMRVPARDFVLPRRSDVTRLRLEGVRLVHTVLDRVPSRRP